MKNINPSQTAAWQALQQHFEQIKDVQIRDLFAQDSERFSKFSATFNDHSGRRILSYTSSRGGSKDFLFLSMRLATIFTFPFQTA